MEKFVMLIHLQSALTTMLTRLRGWIDRQQFVRGPASDGTEGQVLTTDGKGVRSWSTVEPSGAAAAALEDAKGYTDKQIAAIPTPDVSGQIQEHNEDETAHPSIRESVEETRAYAKEYTDTWLGNHNTSAAAHPYLQELIGDKVDENEVTAAISAAKVDMQEYAQGRVAEHNKDTTAHPDIREFAQEQFRFVYDALQEHNDDENAHQPIYDHIGETAASLVTYAGNQKTLAVQEANAYTDEKFKDVTAPDVSGQIAEHNADEEAHPYIRELIEAGKLDVPFLYEYMPEGYPKVDDTESAVPKTTMEFTGEYDVVEVTGAYILEYSTYRLTIDGVSFEAVAQWDGTTGYVTLGTESDPMMVRYLRNIEIKAPAGRHTVKIDKVVEATVETMADKFLPVIPYEKTPEGYPKMENGAVKEKLDNAFLNLDWIPTVKGEQLAAAKTVTNKLGAPTETTGGFPDLSQSEVTDGEKIVVIWDGAEYRTTVEHYSYSNTAVYWVAGNKSYWGEAEDTGEPFLLLFMASNTVTLYKDGVPHTAAVYKENVSQVPEEFLADHNANPDAHPELRELIDAAKLEVPFSYSYMPDGYPKREMIWVVMTEKAFTGADAESGYLGAGELIAGDRYRFTVDDATYEGVAEEVNEVTYTRIWVGDLDGVYIQTTDSVNLWVHGVSAEEYTVKLEHLAAQTSETLAKEFLPEIPYEKMPDGYPRKEEGEVILTEMAVTKEDGEYGYLGAGSLILGERYRFTVDDTVYESVAAEFTDGAGNTGIYVGEIGGVNIHTDYSNLYLWIDGVSAGDYIVSLERLEKITTMADEFLPESALTGADLAEHNADPAAHPPLQEAIIEQMRAEMLQMLSDLGLVSVASSDGSVLYTSNDGKIYVL